MKLSLRVQAVIGIGTIEVAILVVLLYSVFHFMDDSIHQEVDRRAQSIARVLAANAVDNLLLGNRVGLQDLVSATARADGIEFARILDYEGRLLVEAGSPESLKQPFERSRRAELLPDLYMAKAVITQAGLGYGSVEIGLDLSGQKRAMAGAKRNSVMIAGLEVLTAALFSMLAGHYLVRRLRRIRRFLKSVNQGDYLQRLDDHGTDEVSDIAAEIDQLADRLVWEKSTRDARIHELEVQNELLQTKLAEQLRKG